MGLSAKKVDEDIFSTDLSWLDDLELDDVKSPETSDQTAFPEAFPVELSAEFLTISDQPDVTQLDIDDVMTCVSPTDQVVSDQLAVDQPDAGQLKAAELETARPEVFNQEAETPEPVELKAAELETVNLDDGKPDVGLQNAGQDHPELSGAAPKGLELAGAGLLLSEEQPGDQMPEVLLASDQFPADQPPPDLIIVGQEPEGKSFDATVLASLAAIKALDQSQFVQPDESVPNEAQPDEAHPDEVLPESVFGWQVESDLSEEQALSPELVVEPLKDAISEEELPVWLKAMKPIEALDLEGASDSALADQVERIGPLAGLVGALPAEPHIAQSIKPPVYSNKLRVSDTQQAQAALLTALIESEGTGAPLPPAPLIKSQSLMRLTIAIALFAVIAFSLLTGFPSLKTPPLSAEGFIANQLVEQLPPDKPVLVVVDYAPGYSAEVETALVAVLTRWISEGRSMALVSSQPTGVFQAERMLARVVERTGAPQPENVTNLGFIPGGAPGLQAFAQDPHTAIQYNADGEPAWEGPSLTNVNKLTDFGALVLATENLEIARLWLEQVQPLIGNTPFLMVASQQNEPMLRPYYDSNPKKIQGLISGLPGAIQFEILAGKPGDALRIWSTFAIGLFTVVILVAIGALGNMGVGFFVRRRDLKKQGGKP